MEACATSHYWGRMAIACGHEVRLIPLIYVKPFVKRQKNDAADAAAIAEAALRPNMHFVAVKSAEHQARAVAFRAEKITLPNRGHPHTPRGGSPSGLWRALNLHAPKIQLMVTKMV